MDKLYLCKSEDSGRILNNRGRYIFNFLNQHDLYFFGKEPKFREVLTKSFSKNFVDGFLIAFFLSIKKLKRIKRLRGPSFTLKFLENQKLNKNKKHFFIGLLNKDLSFLNKKFNHLKRNKLFCYNPPYIKEIIFNKEEINKIIELIYKINPDYIWVCIGSPKQNILSYSLFKKTKARYFFNVGAALDFILKKKKESPSFIQKIGLEWFFRLVTDFKYTKKKVWRSFLSIFLINHIEMQRNNKN
jgi:N-acetylglucosaminyldiphosphoundecaprenol N-acetyl-beta-D-mannosaminyltransferase